MVRGNFRLEGDNDQRLQPLLGRTRMLDIFRELQN